MLFDASKLLVQQIENGTGSPAKLVDVARAPEQLEAIGATLVDVHAAWRDVTAYFLLSCSFRDYEQALQALEALIVWARAYPILTLEADATRGESRLRVEWFLFNEVQIANPWTLLQTPLQPAILVRLNEHPG